MCQLMPDMCESVNTVTCRSRFGWKSTQRMECVLTTINVGFVTKRGCARYTVLYKLTGVTMESVWNVVWWKRLLLSSRQEQLLYQCISYVQCYIVHSRCTALYWGELMYCCLSSSIVNCFGRSPSSFFKSQLIFFTLFSKHLIWNNTEVCAQRGQKYR